MYDDIIKTIEAADRCRGEIVLCLLGHPGIGKTQAVYEFAKKHNRNVVEIIASQILPNEVSGITMPNDETKSMEIFDHVRLASLRDGDVLFFDELLQASPQVLSACLTLIQERRMMSGRMLPDILIVAAANPLATANQIPVSIRQRFMFYNCKYDSVEFSNYLQKRYGISYSNNLDGLIKRVDFQATTYNVLTPRTITKMLDWMNSAEDDCQKRLVRLAIENMFDANIADLISSVIAPSYKKIIMGIMDDLDLDSDLIKDSDAEDILRILSSLPEWKEISERLENVKEGDYRV